MQLSSVATSDSNGNRISGTMNGNAFSATFDDQDRLVILTNPQTNVSSSTLSTTSTASDTKKSKKISKLKFFKKALKKLVRKFVIIRK
jgi:hypothetical protein